MIPQCLFQEQIFLFKKNVNEYPCHNEIFDIPIWIHLHIDNFVYILGYNGFYIGLTDIVEEDTFVWISSGKTATYTNWGTIQPNNRYGNENCVVFRNEPGYVMTWTDDPCTDLNNYICEMA